MTPAPRWPLHPAPKEGEALSSWLRRVAACYEMDERELLEHGLGCGQIDGLDRAPPMSLLTALAERSGVALDRLRCMSLAGWVPWLLDSLGESAPNALETYAFQLSVLLPKRELRTQSPTSWRAWLPGQPIQRACPTCMNVQADQPSLLVWTLPLMLSCPQHGCWLESYWGKPGLFIGWEKNDPSPRAASATITAMDQRTWQALTTGHVDLPRRRIHAGLWFRLLRTLLEELNTPISRCGPSAKTIRSVWDRCGRPLRAGQHVWRPYETLDLAVQLQMLEAAATAIQLIESETFNACGMQSALFLPKPEIHLPPVSKREPKAVTVNHWHEAMKAFREAMIEARHNPETACSLFALAAYGSRHDPAALERLRADFAEEQVPLEFLSHYDSKWPFTEYK